ncbi:signal recognition particle-docking protein FtsY [Pseudomonas syringae]|uniref:Signal recognition particle receptor FtsY n=1 Tax=Pseudomonas syringae TaxID=317 RepID=A0A085VCJ4_PSESX|nr:signal recognition particle-docking protein FtsY [Pseudomonas syringae]KFE53157.1 cell division protein FtsY [Pseudomonas syringae]
MFGSNDDKKNPAPAGEKKGLFGWLRKKPQETPVEPPQDLSAAAPEPVIESTPDAVEPQFAPAETQPPVGETVVVEATEPQPQSQPLSDVPHQPWPSLPVAEEPVALVNEYELHITPPIAPQYPVDVQHEAQTEPEPRIDVPMAEPESTIVPEPEPVAVEPEPQPEPVIPPVVAALSPAAAVAAAPAIDTPPAPVAVQPEATKAGFFARLKQGLSKTSASIGEGMASLFLGKKAIDDDLLEEIETRLLTADVGVEATSVIIQSLTQKVARKQLTDAQALYTSLQQELATMLKPVEQPLIIDVSRKPFVILVVGVNGAGKTTTIGKLAKKLQLEGKKVMLAAGDTFRAAAVEQLQVWGERNSIPVIAQHTGADSASVIFDAVQAAKARGIDVLIADTAGRLHTKDNLMEELKKVRRVMGKLDAEAPHEVLLVLDAGTGQNAINQAKQFNQTVQLTGLALTKLDGTAKGGVIFALAKQFGLPIRYIGVGEGIDDLRTFEAEPFVQALFAEREAK